MIIAPRALAILYSFLQFNCNKQDYFILPANICHSVSWCFIKAGVPVIFCDIDPLHLCLNLKRVRTLCQGMPCQGLLFNHTYGTLYYPDEEFQQLRQQQANFFIVDDRCLCFPQLERGLSTELSADLTLFSTGYAKCIDVGYGGIGYASISVSLPEIIPLPYDSDDETWLEQRYKAKLPITDDDIKARNWLCTTSNFDHKKYLQDIAFSLPIIQQKKNTINNIYRSGLKGPVTIFSDEFNLWRFNIWTSRQKALLDALFACGLFASAHYQIEYALQNDCPVATQLASGIINLFNDCYFTDEQAHSSVKVINGFLAQV